MVKEVGMLRVFARLCSVNSSRPLSELARHTDSLEQRARSCPYFSAIVGYMPAHNWTFPRGNVPVGSVTWISLVVRAAQATMLALIDVA